MPYLAGVGPLGPLELVLIVTVIIIIFGVGKLPQVGGALGRSFREFRANVREETQEPDAQSRQLPEAPPTHEPEQAKSATRSEGEEPPRLQH
ncbi:MAG: twin-arginine translocase TatA/TatE family subunit [Dehalococcoidia bacterium]